MAVVICARDPLTFLARLGADDAGAGRGDPRSRATATSMRAQTVFSYLAVTHLGGAGMWIAILLLAAGRRDRRRLGDHAPAPGLQTPIALAALVGIGTKAGVMPLHVWLPRAHPVAPAPVSALMCGVMIKVAIYGARPRARRLGRRAAALARRARARRSGALSAVGGVTYALFEHDLKRLLALHSIENVGIIVLGIGACLILRARGADQWAAFALAAALLHTVNHAVFKALLFLGAGAFERAVGALEIDRLGGLLRRMPWTGAGFLVGAMAIAGLPPLNGFASEWLTLQALLHVSAYGNVADGLAGAIALAALASTAALALFCFVKVVGLVLLGAPRRAAVAASRGGPVADGRRRHVPRRRLRRARRSRPACCSARSSASRRGRRPRRAAVGLHLPGTGSLPTVGIALVLVALTAGLTLAARPAQRRARSELGVRTARRACTELDERRLHQAAPPRARGDAPPAARDHRPQRRRRRPGSHVPRPCPAPHRRSPVPADRPSLAGLRPPTRDDSRAAASGSTSST